MNSIIKKPWGYFEVLTSGKNFLVKRKENESIFIPQGAIHRMANKTKKNLIIIELWYGEKLDENDIKRYEDIYKRI